MARYSVRRSRSSASPIWLIELLLSIVSPSALNALVNFGAIQPMLAVSRPWTFITSMFLHQPTSILHILFNMLTLWSVGPMLERLMGHWPFLALYMLSGIGGGMGMMLWGALAPGPGRMVHGRLRRLRRAVRPVRGGADRLPPCGGGHQLHAGVGWSSTS